MPRRRYKWRVETYLYLHNQTEDGYVVRFVHWHGRRKLYDQSRYFSTVRHGSLVSALRRAREYKEQHVANHLTNIHHQSHTRPRHTR